MRPAAARAIIAAVESFEIRPLSDALGAEIAGLDVTQPVDADTAAALMAAWREHIVLLFRTPGLTQDQQLRFAQAFGEIGRRPGRRGSGPRTRRPSTTR